jgi:hypothetical protein
MHQAEEIIEAGFAEPFGQRERNGELVDDQYADLTDAIRERIQQQAAAQTDPKTGMPLNRHGRRRAAVLGRKTR